MQYRKLGKTGLDVSILGFGLMRFPTVDGTPYGKIDEKESVKMIKTAVDSGINFFDTAYIYPDSEEITGKALKGGYREKVILQTKSPTWLLKKKGDFTKKLDEALTRLQTSYLDVLLLHSLDKASWEGSVKKLDLLTEIENAKKEGKTRHIGFSFHDEYPVFKNIVNGYDGWEACLIQMNYMNEQEQAGLEGLRLLHEKNIGAMIMEPLLGGRLANHASNAIDLFKSANPDRTPVEWALDYLWDKPEVSVVLSGMSSMEQLQNNIQYANRASVGMLTDKDRDTIKQVQKIVESTFKVPCTGCNYCMPCPSGVNIPMNFKVYNELAQFNSPVLSKSSYAFMKFGGGKNEQASECKECGECEEKCPQHIKIMEKLKEVHNALT